MAFLVKEQIGHSTDQVQIQFHFSMQRSINILAIIQEGPQCCGTTTNAQGEMSNLLHIATKGGMDIQHN